MVGTVVSSVVAPVVGDAVSVTVWPAVSVTVWPAVTCVVSVPVESFELPQADSPTTAARPMKSAVVRR